jgi:hypothetical protein
MDASALMDLHELSDRRREVEHLLAFATLASDQKELKNELRAVTRKVTKLLEKISGSYSHDFVECRDVGHVWNRVSSVLGDDDVLTRTLHCARCDTYREDRLKPGGDLAGRKYSHGEGYLIDNAGTTTPKSFWRGLAYLEATR